MKKIMIISLMLILVMSAISFAQYEYPVDEGSIIIGGSAGYNNYDGYYGDDRLGVLTINPQILYFFFPGFGVGADIYYVSTYSRGDSAYQLSLGPKMAYYFGSRGSRTMPFIELSFTLGNGSNAESSTGIQFGGGLAYMIVEHVAVTGKASFRSSGSGGSSYSYSSNSFGLNFGLAIFIY